VKDKGHIKVTQADNIHETSHFENTKTLLKFVFQRHRDYEVTSSSDVCRLDLDIKREMINGEVKKKKNLVYKNNFVVGS
jgi:hypothetical protein